MTTPADSFTQEQEQPGSPSAESFLAYGQWLNDPVVAPYLEQVQQDTSGRGYHHMNEIEFQEMLNQDSLIPSFSLKGITGLTAPAASVIISSEIDTNFHNALAHVREAQELFPDDATFSGSDVDVVRRMRVSPMHVNAKDIQKKSSFFGQKKKKDETSPDKKGKKTDVEYKGENLSEEFAPPATPRELKVKEKKEKREKKKAEKEEKRVEKEEKKKEKKEKKREKKEKEPEGSSNKTDKKPSLFTKLLRRGSSAKEMRNNADGDGVQERALADDVVGSEPATSGRGDNSARETSSARDMDSAREANAALEVEEHGRVLMGGDLSFDDHPNP